jgi:glycerol dehydrogenase
VAEAACVPTQSTKNLPFPVGADEVSKAILEADRLGREYTGPAR